MDRCQVQYHISLVQTKQWCSKVMGVKRLMINPNLCTTRKKNSSLPDRGESNALTCQPIDGGNRNQMMAHSIEFVLLYCLCLPGTDNFVNYYFSHMKMLQLSINQWWETMSFDCNYHQDRPGHWTMHHWYWPLPRKLACQRMDTTLPISWTSAITMSDKRSLEPIDKTSLTITTRMSEK